MVAAGLDLVMQVPGLARDTNHVLELDEMGLQFADRINHQFHVGGNDALAPTVADVAAQRQFLGLRAPVQLVAMRSGATSIGPCCASSILMMDAFQPRPMMTTSAFLS